MHLLSHLLAPTLSSMWLVLVLLTVASDCCSYSDRILMVLPISFVSLHIVFLFGARDDALQGLKKKD